MLHGLQNDKCLFRYQTSAMVCPELHMRTFTVRTSEQELYGGTLAVLVMSSDKLPLWDYR